MKLVYISDNKLYLCKDGAVTELKSEKADQYRQTVVQINHQNEWKYSGTGARFTGTYRPTQSEESVWIRINGITSGDKGIMYSADLGGLGGIYGKDIDKDKAAEDHVFTSMDMKIGEIAVKDGRIAAIANGHLTVFEKDGGYREITDGDTNESAPCWSVTDSRIFCSTSGFARDGSGAVAAMSPQAVIAVDLEAGEMNELFADEKYDLMKPSNDKEGCFYYIKRPYNETVKKPSLIKDVLLFPFRIIKATVGLLNAFSIFFGGESLRSGKQQNGDVKMKQKSDKELYFEDRLIEAEKNQKENAAAGDKNPGIIPRSRVLVKVSSDGSETVIKKGVLDYKVLSDSSIICSNGSQLIHIVNGNENVIAKAKLAHCICEVKE